MDVLDRHVGTGGRDGWFNKLIKGDNRLVLSTLLNGDMRKGIEDVGGLKLIYIDPPFNTGRGFGVKVPLGGDSFEVGGYGDSWGGIDSFIAMIYERLILMRDLLAEDGSIYVHCDWRVNSYLKNILDEIFGPDHFRNELIWSYSGWRRADNNQFSRKHDTIYFYSANSTKWNYKGAYESWVPGYTIQELRSLDKGLDETGDFVIIDGQNIYLTDFMEGYIKNRKQSIKRDANGQFVWADGRNTVKRYLKDVLVEGKAVDDVWDIRALTTSSNDRLGYDTQKPEELIYRFIEASSNKGDLVADFFCGSGTMAAVAEKLGRKWICTDLGKFSIHTTRKRMIGVQRQLKKDGKCCLGFEVLEVGDV